MITGHFKFTRPDDLEAVAEIRMKIGEWRQLREQLRAGSWPASDFARIIDNLITQADKVFYENQSNLRRQETE